MERCITKEQARKEQRMEIATHVMAGLAQNPAIMTDEFMSNIVNGERGGKPLAIAALRLADQLIDVSESI